MTCTRNIERITIVLIFLMSLSLISSISVRSDNGFQYKVYPRITFNVNPTEVVQIQNSNYEWIWETYEGAPSAFPGEDCVYWGTSLGPYHNYTEVTDKLHNLETNFPDYVDVFSIGQSIEGRELWTVRITNESIQTGKTEYYVVGAHHAREAITVENSLFFIDRLMHDLLNQNITVEELVNSTEIYVIPLLNPDGHSILHWYPPQRKNLRPIDDDRDGTLIDEKEVRYIWNSTINISQVIYEDLDGDGSIGEDAPGGVDLNRNYDYFWSGPGSSSRRRSDVFRGFSGNSEPEVQALVDFSYEHDFRWAVSLHSGIKALIAPWGHTNDPPPHAEEFEAVLSALKNITGFPTWEEVGGYATNGDWGDHQLGIRDILAITIETYGNDSSDYFWEFFNPPADQVIANSELIYNALFLLATNPHYEEENSIPVLSEPTLELIVDGQYLNVSWDAFDTDQDDLVFTLYYGSNNKWHALSRNISSYDYLVDLAAIPTGEFQFRVSANDGIDRVVSTSQSVTIIGNIRGTLNGELLSNNKIEIQLQDRDLNKNESAIEEVIVFVNSTADPLGLNVLLKEESENSTLFASRVKLVDEKPSENNELYVNKKDTVTIYYTDEETQTGEHEIIQFSLQIELYYPPDEEIETTTLTEKTNYSTLLTVTGAIIVVTRKKRKRIINNL